ncbi:MAG TPA: hypothetical protein VFS21_34440 [Roseiflexaceae bacterium]|nr:hypothetical protein [Roseiflexaceae bacterium]
MDTDTTSSVCLRYLLRDSVARTPPGTPRPVVYVALEADDLDASGTPQIEGDLRSVGHVRGSLGELRSSGLHGQLLDELPTPRNLAAVMSRPFVRERYDPVCIAGFRHLLPPETAFADAAAGLAAVIASLLAETLPRLPNVEPQAIAALVEQIDLIVVLGRGLADGLPQPDNALAQLADAVWGLLGQTGKDAAWLAKTVSETVPVLEMLYIRAPQRHVQVEAVVRHIAGALADPRSGTLAGLVAQLEAGWAVEPSGAAGQNGA